MVGYAFSFPHWLQTVKLVSEFDRIVYISCNPETLLENLRDLMPTHRLERFAAFDQVGAASLLLCSLACSLRPSNQVFTMHAVPIHTPP